MSRSTEVVAYLRQIIRATRFRDGVDVGKRRVSGRTLKQVLTAYGDAANNTEPVAFPGAETIADRVGISERVVRDARDALVDLGWLMPDGKVGRALRFRVVVPVEIAADGVVGTGPAVIEEEPMPAGYTEADALREIATLPASIPALRRWLNDDPRHGDAYSRSAKVRAAYAKREQEARNSGQ